MKKSHQALIDLAFQAAYEHAMSHTQPDPNMQGRTWEKLYKRLWDTASLVEGPDCHDLTDKIEEAVMEGQLEALCEHNAMLRYFGMVELETFDELVEA